MAATRRLPKADSGIGARVRRMGAQVDLEGLNGPQRDAVLHGEGPLVVFAGAGSGKTRVITHRIAHLVDERRVTPWSILAVTFTNKAAGEMRERLGALLRGTGVQPRQLWIGTFHATCARILRTYAEEAEVKKDFTIYDDSDQRAMVKRVLNELNLDPKRFPIRQVQGTINRAKQEVISPEEFETGDPYREIAQRVYGLYEEKMRAAGSLDFGDLIYRMVRALEKNETFREELSARFQYVLVDEFQDTNHAQFRLVRALTASHQNVCVVGDDDQSIYRWRGADRRNILDFRESFPSAEIIKLEQNYRSTQRILRVAHSVIRRNVDREPKEMWTDNDEGEKVLVVRTEDERDEARMVVRGVRELLNKGDSLADIAVFYRTHAQSRVLEEALRAENLPYKVVGGVRFYDRAEVKDLLAYLRVLHNPDDDVSLQRIINVPARGIGKTSVGRLIDVAAERGIGLYAALREVAGDARFGAAATKKLGAFLTLMEKLRRDAAQLPLADLPGAILEDTSYVQQLIAEDTPEADAKVQNLEELVGSIQQSAQQNPQLGLAEFLADVTLQSSADEQVEGDTLTLMTVHAAKGLEFDTVMVVGLEEGMFPFKGTEAHEDPDELEEERRLVYVAFTRAREQLILSYARRRRVFGQERPGDPSRFLYEIPKEDAHWIGVSAPTRPRPVPRERVSVDPWDTPSADTGGAPRESNESYVDMSEGSDFGPLRRGMKVRHPKFGVGEVQSLSGGAPPRAVVVFPGWGRRTIVARFLQPV